MDKNKVMYTLMETISSISLVAIVLQAMTVGVNGVALHQMTIGYITMITKTYCYFFY